MNFSSASNATLSDSLSGYVTCDDEDPDNTQYLSVLGQDVSFEGMSVTLCNSDVDNDETHLVEINSEEDISEPFIFTIDGSDEIYGVQTAPDEDGNLQKYQIQYTKNMDGELIPMLETIQLLLPEDDEHEEIAIADNLITTDNMDVVQQSIRSNQLIEDKQGNNCDSEANIDFREHEDEFNQSGDTADNTDCKSEIISIPTLTYSNACIKEESIDLFDENSRHQYSSENTDGYVSDEMEMANVGNLKVETNIPDSQVRIEDNDTNTISAEHFEMDNIIENERQNEFLGPVEEHFEQLFVQENHIADHCQMDDSDDIRDNDSDNETYHIVDGMHITGDVESENSFEQPIETVLKETVEHHPKTNILKKSFTKSVSKDQDCADQKIIYVQRLPEKENMEIIEVGRLAKPNSRSLLKCNQPPQPLIAVPDPLHIELAAGEGTNSNIKRYSRTKEAKQARQFINFINSTTISQVPERKERLPRKQQIKPVKHLNEDIIVKEMIVSSNGFIEPISAEEKKHLPVTEYVEVLDSGDECSGDGDERKKKKSKKLLEPIEIEISDSDESDISIIEANNQINGCDHNKSDVITKSEITKKKRGRPPKNKNLDNDKKDSDSNSESPPKISRTESDVESVTSSLEVIRVEHEAVDYNACKNSTNTVNLDECSSKPNINNKSIRSDNVIIPSADVNSAGTRNQPARKDINSTIVTSNFADERQQISKTLQQSEVIPKKGFEYKHECEKCKTKFINKFLLNRHDCIVKSGLPFSCDNCQKKFPNITSLNIHKKVHVKGPTTIRSSVSTKIPQIKKTVPKECGSSSKCTSKISVSNMKNTGEVSIKNSMKESIPVKNPIRACVPTTKYPPRPLMASSKIGQNHFVKPKEPVVITPDKTSKTNIFKFDKQCDKCSEKFDNNAAWFDHQVLQHGFKTPDQSIGEKKQKKLVKNVVEHNGVRPGPAVARNFSMFRSKIQQLH